MNEHADIARVLVREIGLSELESRLYVLIATKGAMDAASASVLLGADKEHTKNAADRLVELGGFIDYDKERYESMHPRFSTVNMYRRACQARGVRPTQNFAIDNTGAALEKEYDHARAKYNKTDESS